MANVSWDKYEYAMLIESYWLIKDGKVNRTQELFRLSDDLHRMAKNRDIETDEYFRSVSGITTQMIYIETAFVDGPDSPRIKSTLVGEMVKIYQNERETFYEILQQAHDMVGRKIRIVPFVIDNKKNNDLPAVSVKQVHKNNKTRTTKIVYEFELLDQKKSLAEIFDVDASLFCAVPVDSLDLSVRASNCLKKENCFTVEQLLSYSVSQLQCVRNLGARSLDEIIKKVKSITSTSTAETHRASVLRHKTSKYKIDIPSNTEFGGKIEALLAGQPIEIANDEEKNVVEQINSAIDEVGVELCSTTYSNPKYGKTICDMLWKFAFPEISKQQAWQLIVEKINALPQAKRDVLALPYIYVYEAQRKRSLGIIKELCNATTTVGQIRFFRTHILTSEDGELCLGELPSFFDWVLTDFSAEMDTIIESLKSSLSQKTTMAIDILYERERGATLEEIGKKYGQTRESIRQKEKKASRKFWEFYKRQPNDLMLLIYLMRNGDSVLCFDEVKETIGEFAYILWTALKNNPSHANFHFSKKANAVVIRQFDERTSIDEQLNVKIDALSNLFPTIVHESEKDALIERLSDEADLPTEIIEVQFDGHYRRSGQFYHRGNLTITFMCDFVLKQEFRDGYKIASPEFAKEFKKQLNKYFGKDTSSTTNHSIDAKISEVGVLCDRGKYLHPDYLHVDKWIIDEINTYIDANEKIVITYSEVFDALREILSGSQITNRFFLQGALKFYGCKYNLTRDYITKEQGRSLTNEFEDFAKERGEFHKSEFFAIFPTMTEANLAMLIGRCPNVFSIDNGYYMHSSVLNLSNNDYDEIRKYLAHICIDGPVSSRYLFEEFSYKFIDFMTRNRISNHAKLFGILSYMFVDEYTFSRPYISKGDDISLTNKDVILRHLDGFDTISIEDVLAICRDRGIRYLSSSYLIHLISPNFIRINENTLMRYELTGIHDDVILEVVNYVASRVETNKYCSVATIKDYLLFPTIKIEWTAYLVESIMYLSNDMIGKIINIPTSNLSNLTSIYVGEEYEKDDYSTFILKVVDSAFKQGLFTTKAELREFLAENGLINYNKLPGFLEGTEYYYVDEEGILRSRQ